MKALTLKAEFADLVLSGEKRFENRTWGEHRKLVGKRIAIHRGGENGCIICTVVIKAIIDVDTALRLFPSQEEHICGPNCWLLGDLVRVKPIYCKGKLSLWDVPTGEKLIPITEGM